MPEYKEHVGLVELHDQLDSLPIPDSDKPQIRSLLHQFGNTRAGWRTDTRETLMGMADVTRLLAGDVLAYGIETEIDHESVLKSINWIRENLGDIINYSLKLKNNE